MSHWFHGDGTDADVVEPGARAAVARIGRQLALWLANQVSLLTPHARLFRLRRNLFVLAGCRIHPDAKLVATVRIHHANVDIGDSWIGPGVQLMASAAAPVTIGDNSGIGAESILSVHTHQLGGHDRRVGAKVFAPVAVGSGTWVALRVTMVAGSSVGDGCLVGANSLILENFGDDLFIAGSPARVVREFGPDDGDGDSKETVDALR